MWFRLNFIGLDEDLSVVVGADGNFYFRASEVAKLLHYASPSDFSKRYAYIDESEVLPIRYHHRPALLFTFEHLNILLREKVTKRKRCKWDVDGFFDRWYNGFVTTEAPLRMEYRCHTNGMRICVGDTGVIRLQDWLVQFRNATLDFYKGLNPQPEPEPEPRTTIKQEVQSTSEAAAAAAAVPEEICILLNGQKYRYVLVVE